MIIESIVYTHRPANWDKLDRNEKKELIKYVDNHLVANKYKGIRISYDMDSIRVEVSVKSHMEEDKKFQKLLFKYKSTNTLVGEVVMERLIKNIIKAKTIVKYAELGKE